ncbi:MAG: enoyl-CoA hydratase/isomerase family protein [Pseudomonadota bacterium]
MILKIAPPVARIEIDRPAKSNAFTLDMWETLPKLIDNACAADGVRVIIFTGGTPGIFSAGADIGELLAMADNRELIERHQSAVFAAREAVLHAPLPTIARIDGDCMGGGLLIAAACDFRLARDDVRFGLPPARLGLGYAPKDVAILCALISFARAKRMLLTARPISSNEASDWGLCDLFADTSALDDAVSKLVDDLVAVSAQSQADIKQSFAQLLANESLEDTHARAALEAAYAGDDFREGMQAFLEKRRPQF